MRADLRLRSRGGSVEENEGRGGGGRERGAEDAEGDGPEDRGQEGEGFSWDLVRV